MFGIPDWQVSMAYILTLLSAILCVVYGIVKWNSDM